MNTYTASEHAAALELQTKAATLVCTYAEPKDAAAARLAVLMLAAEQEAREQGYVTKVGFLHQEAMEADRVRLLEALKRVVNTVPAIGDGGGFIFDHHSPDGEYLGSENVDPMSVVQEMASVAMNAIAQSEAQS